MRIRVKPAGKGQFWAFNDGFLGAMIGQPSSQPMLDAARVLLELGCDPGEVIELWHEGASEWALRSTIGVAARLTVIDRPSRSPPRFELWQPFGLDRE